ncbi:MAG: hypothetical protein OEZ34_02195 [Spirochaetia bacterium]|nr:hypothetical protein [Spirochaetia bacterium]
MKSSKYILLSAALFLAPQLYAEEHPSGKKGIDRDRTCSNVENQKNKGTDQFVYPSSFIEQTNYEGKEYRKDMTNLLVTEINRIKNLLSTIEKRHTILTKLYPQYRGYQEIVLEEKPGFWEFNEYVYYKKLMAFHFSSDHKISCVVIDSERKNIKNSLIFKRKLIRLYNPYIQSMEIESRSHYSKISETMDDATPEMQLKSLRLMTAHLNESLYAIDIMISSYYNKRQKRNSDLISL